jgi:predicted site-specific integrase-resolvase
MSDADQFVLPGLMLRREFARRVGRSERTIKRWTDAGRLVVVELGNERWIDTEKSSARLRGERPARGRK